MLDINALYNLLKQDAQLVAEMRPEDDEATRALLQWIADYDPNGDY